MACWQTVTYVLSITVLFFFTKTKSALIADYNTPRQLEYVSQLADANVSKHACSSASRRPNMKSNLLSFSRFFFNEMICLQIIKIVRTNVT